MISNVAAAAIGGAFQTLNTGTSILAQHQLAKENREWNEKMWDKTNEYNTPAAQMSRFKDAGLNPNLMYGQISNPNASNLTMQDPYNAKGIGEALNKLDFQQMALAIAKSAEELEGMKLDNARKHYEVIDESAKVSMRQYEIAAAEQYAADLGYRVSEDGTYFVTPEGNQMPTITTSNSPAVISYLIRFRNEMDYLTSKTSDINTRNELNEVKKETQRLINAFKTTENKWQPWLYGADIGGKAINAITGALRLKFPKREIKYNNYYMK